VFTYAALEFLDLGGNYITGTLPETLGNMTRLRLLNIGKNGFTDLGKGVCTGPCCSAADAYRPRSTT
jgi:hypothetical protein